jgi:hypothetical protein
MHKATYRSRSYDGQRDENDLIVDNVHYLVPRGTNGVLLCCPLHVPVILDVDRKTWGLQSIPVTCRRCRKVERLGFWPFLSDTKALNEVLSPSRDG